MSDNNQYKFNSKFQEQILAVILKDIELVTDVVSVVNHNYFTDPTLSQLARQALKFIDQYQGVPNLEQFISFVDSPEYTKRIKRIYKLKIKNKLYIRDQIIEFAKFNAMKAAIVESSEMLTSGIEFATIEKTISEAMKIGVNLRNLGTDLLLDRKERFRQRQIKGLDSSKIPTGIDRLDKIMTGGLSPGELGVILAAPKGFKTGTLTNLGASALNRGYFVAHFTLEVSEDKQTQRYERRLAGLDHKDVILKTNKLNKVLKRIETLGGGLVIKGFPTRSVTVSHINNHLGLLEAEGFIPDLIIVDYGDLVKPSIKGEKRDQLGIIYAELRAMGQTRNAAVWTASQANRKALNKKLIGKGDIAESFEKIAIADIVVAVCQTREERQMSPSRARLFISAHREGEEGVIIYITIDYDKMRIKPLEGDF